MQCYLLPIVEFLRNCKWDSKSRVVCIKCPRNANSSEFELIYQLLEVLGLNSHLFANRRSTPFSGVTWKCSRLSFVHLHLGVLHLRICFSKSGTQITMLSFGKILRKWGHASSTFLPDSCHWREFRVVENKFASMAIWEYQTLVMLFQDAALQEVRGQQTINTVLQFGFTAATAPRVFQVVMCLCVNSVASFSWVVSSDHFSSFSQQFVVKMGISSRSFQARTCAGFSQTAAVHYFDEMQAESQVLQSRSSHVYMTHNIGWGNGNSGCWVGARLQVDITKFCLLVTYILEYCIFRSVFSEVCHPFRHVYSLNFTPRSIKHGLRKSAIALRILCYWEFF